MVAMKRSRVSDQRIAFVLQPAEQGTPVGEVTRKMGISGRRGPADPLELGVWLGRMVDHQVGNEL
jgi:hypothetical protein